MLVQQNSIYKIVSTVIKLQTLIIAIYATQQIDLSIRDITLILEDQIILYTLRNFFYIFVKLSQKLQASLYLIFNFAIPQYLKIINKLKALQKEVGILSTISLAYITTYNKLNNYYTLTTNQQQSYLGVATICNPYINLNVFNSLWPSSTKEVKQNQVKQQFHDIFN